MNIDVMELLCVCVHRVDFKEKKEKQKENQALYIQCCHIIVYYFLLF